MLLTNSNYFKSGTSAVLALLMSVTAVAPMLTLAPAQAQSFYRYRNWLTTYNSQIIPAGTTIPVRFEGGSKILVTKTETLPLTLLVANDITDGQGNILIPEGSEISGQIEPTGAGSYFVAQTLTIDSFRKQSLVATSPVINRTQIVRRGANAGEILAGTFAGAGAATLIAGLTGNRRIGALEVLAGAAVGTLAGWALPETGTLGGGEEQELIVIEPNRDLTLTLQSPLSLQ